MDKLTYKITEIAPKTWAIDEYSMDYMYIAEGENESLVIDTGTGTGDYKAVVESLTQKPYKVVCTHGHVDHCGGIGQFNEIFMHNADIEDVCKEDGTISVFNRRRYAKRGFAVNDPERLPFTMETFKPIDTSKIKFTAISEGFCFNLGGRTIEVFEIPGHSKGCICLLDKENKILFAGDSICKILILPLDGDDISRVKQWYEGAKKIYAMKDKYDVIYSGHHCPLDMQIFKDQLTCAEKIISGELKKEYMAIDEFEGYLYHYGKAWFTLDKENLDTRDYNRINKFNDK